ncbi:MAG: transposase [Neobacillus sp.]
MDWSLAKRRQKDIDATWMKKHGKPCFGYKLSASTDKRYEQIRKIKVSTASEHDTFHMDEVLDTFNTSRDLYGDKGKPRSDCQSGAILELSKHVPELNMYLPAWNRWKAKVFVALG